VRRPTLGGRFCLCGPWGAQGGQGPPSVLKLVHTSKILELPSRCGDAVLPFYFLSFYNYRAKVVHNALVTADAYYPRKKKHHRGQMRSGFRTDSAGLRVRGVKWRILLSSRWTSPKMVLMKAKNKNRKPCSGNVLCQTHGVTSPLNRL